MKAKIYNTDGKLVALVEGSIEQIEINVPAGGRYEEVADDDHFGTPTVEGN